MVGREPRSRVSREALMNQGGATPGAASTPPYMASSKLIRLSSWSTVLTKLLAVPIGILSLFLFELDVFRSSMSRFAGIVGLLFGTVIVTFVGWYCSQLKFVWADTHSLHISTWFKGVVISFDNIQSVSESVLLTVVIVHFKSPSLFGDRIYFMPTLPVVVFFGPHPVTEQLRHMVKNASPRTDAI